MQLIASCESFTACYGGLQKENMKEMRNKSRLDSAIGNKKEHEGRERKLLGELMPGRKTIRKMKAGRGNTMAGEGTPPHPKNV